LKSIKVENADMTRKSNKPVIEEDGTESAMDGPFAKLNGRNINEEIMSDEKFNCFGWYLREVKTRARGKADLTCPAYYADSIAGPDHDYAVPTLDSLGLGQPTTHIQGGEKEALRRLEAFLLNETGVATFSKPKSSPNSLEPSTTLLSPYLKFGCLSVRRFYWDSQDVCEKYAKKYGPSKMTKEPENLAGQVTHASFYILRRDPDSSPFIAARISGHVLLR
jgi:hypothetical protein